MCKSNLKLMDVKLQFNNVNLQIVFVSRLFSSPFPQNCVGCACNQYKCATYPAAMS